MPAISSSSAPGDFPHPVFPQESAPRGRRPFFFFTRFIFYRGGPPRTHTALLTQHPRCRRTTTVHVKWHPVFHATADPGEPSQPSGENRRSLRSGVLTGVRHVNGKLSRRRSRYVAAAHFPQEGEISTKRREPNDPLRSGVLT